jgi:hypothetical protein
MSARSQDDWHQPLRHVRADALSPDTGQTPGMARHEAISARTVGADLPSLDPDRS